jgi:hypothetical protein
MLRTLPLLPMLRTEPKLPMLSNDPALPMLSTLAKLKSDQRLQALRPCPSGPNCSGERNRRDRGSAPPDRRECELIPRTSWRSHTHLDQLLLQL